MEWMCANLATAAHGGQWWAGAGSDDGDGRYFLHTEALAIEPSLPDEWRLPTIAECRALQIALGGAAVAGGKLKTVGIDYWNTPNTGAVDQFGFALRGHGFLHSTGAGWTGKGQGAYFWTSDTEPDLPFTISVCGAVYDSEELFVTGPTSIPAYKHPIRLVRPAGPQGIYPEKDGVWRHASEVYVAQGETWRKADRVFVADAGAWREVQ